jgi:hypothetical protein
MKALYALPRLTVISSVEIAGGGTSTNRSTPLDGTFQVAIFSLPTTAASTSG